VGRYGTVCHAGTSLDNYSYITWTTFINYSPFNVLVVLALHPSLLLLGHLHHSLLKLLIAPFSMLHRVSGTELWNQLQYLFLNLILVTVPPLPTHLPLLIHNSLSLSLPAKTYLFYKSYPPYKARSSTSSSRNAFTDFCLHRFFWANRFLFLVFP